MEQCGQCSRDHDQLVELITRFDEMRKATAKAEDVRQIGVNARWAIAFSTISTMIAIATLILSLAHKV